VRGGVRDRGPWRSTRACAPPREGDGGAPVFVSAPGGVPEGTAGVSLRRSLAAEDAELLQDRGPLHAAPVSHDETLLLKREPPLLYTLRMREAG
jgi:hypothetical protein